MLPVLMLFLIPVGGGIPAGVVLGQKNGLGWPTMTFLYFVSDVILAFLFEPILKLLAAIAGRFPHFALLGAAYRRSMEKTAARYGGSAGPFTLIMIAFGVDPMTGRAAAAAAGHGFVSGWILAITGDMLYFLVIMIATLKLSAVLGDPNRAAWIVLAAMILVPILIDKAKTAFVRRAKRPADSEGRLAQKLKVETPRREV
jgi:hypothetical protein